MLSTTSEYALRIMIALAEHPDPSLTSERIARATQVPGDYAVKVLQLLGRAGLVHAQRGRGGGFRMLCDPSITSLLDVVNAIDPLQRVAACPLARESHQDALCPLHQCIDNVMAELETGLRQMTLQSVIDGSPGPALCAPNASEEARVSVSVVPKAEPVPGEASKSLPQKATRKTS